MRTGTVAQDAARGRRDEALSVPAPRMLGLPRERIVLRVRRGNATVNSTKRSVRRPCFTRCAGTLSFSRSLHRLPRTRGIVPLNHRL